MMVNTMAGPAMNKLFISTDAEAALISIADTGDLQARSEVARFIAILKFLKRKVGHTPDYWNVALSASGTLSSHATAKNGTSLWRLYPTHTHCIGVVAMQDGDLYVLNVCSEFEISSVERDYSNRRELIPTTEPELT